MPLRIRSCVVPAPHGRRFPIALAAIIAAQVVASSSSANPVLGHRESFPPLEGVGSWAGGSMVVNPGTGGVAGDGDGCLEVSNGVVTRLGTTSGDAAYTGDYPAAGVTQVRLWLRDIGDVDPLQIHFSIGYNHGPGAANFWQYDTGFAPPADHWAEFVVPLDGPAGWTQIIGSGTFLDAIQHADRIHVRHDLAPYEQTPDLIAGDFAMDEILLTNGTTDTPQPSAPGLARPIELSAPYPNPSRGLVAFTLRSDAGPVALDVLDYAGRRVRHVELAALAGVPLTWMWDGRDDRGAAVPSGRYLARACGAAGVGASRPFVVVR